jgi:hypothetical protein
MRFGPIELYKKLPKTNCGDCGQPSCLAFATQVVGFGQELGDCIHLDEATLSEVARTIEEQRDKGVFVKKDNHKITREHLREKIENHDFEAIAPGLGLTYTTDNGMDTLEIPYFERTVTMSRTGIVAGGTEEFDPWDEVLLYNYIFFSGSRPLSGEWVGLESFPNSLPKRVALEEGCHKRIHQYFAGARTELESACQSLGGIPVFFGMRIRKRDLRLRQRFFSMRLPLITWILKV